MLFYACSVKLWRVIRECRFSLDGLFIYRIHIDLGDKNPAESSNIKVDRLNKWNTLIQNASLHTYE